MDYEVVMNGNVRIGMKISDFETQTTWRKNKVF